MSTAKMPSLPAKRALGHFPCVAASLSGLLLAGTFFAQAAAPTLDHLFPVAQQAGTTGLVAAIGKFEPWPPKVWVDTPGLVFESTTNSGSFQVRAGADTPPGAYLVRMHNEEGASAVRFFIVTREPQVAEAEPNDDFSKPQSVPVLPASINGRLEKSGDVDSFGVHLETGQSLIAAVEAYVLATPLDAVLRVIDARGTQVALNHDDGRTLDPFLAFTAPVAGHYVVQVFGFPYPADSDLRFTGNAKCVYRLHLFGGAYARYTVPLGVGRDTGTPLRVVGWNFAGASPPGGELVFDGAGVAPGALWTNWPVPGFQNALRLPIGEGPELVEHEPNDALKEAGSVSWPGAVSGRIDRPDDLDRYGFTAKKGEELVFAVQSAALGFGVDTWMRLEDANGKELKRADDSGGMDPLLEWTAPADGAFFAVVGSLLHRGGAESWYRLSARRPAPAVRVLASDHAFKVEAGKTNELKVTVKFLHGAKGKFVAAARGLPDGVRAASADVPEKGGDVVLKLEAAPDLKAFSGPIELVLKDSADGREQKAIFELITSGENNGVPNGYQHLVREETDQLWLTVQPAKPAKTAGGK